MNRTRITLEFEWEPLEEDEFDTSYGPLQDPSTWNWANLIDNASPVRVVESQTTTD